MRGRSRVRRARGRSCGFRSGWPGVERGSRPAASRGRSCFKPSPPAQHLNGNRSLEVAMQTRIRSLAVAALASMLLAAPALALTGPPWISIELPANPYDRSTRDAFLLVHSFHHGTAMGFIVTGTAEGMLNGVRRWLKLDFAETSRRASSL